MPIDIRAPDGSVARFPDGTSDETIRSVMGREYGTRQEQPPPEPMGWGDWFRGLGRQALQGATFNFGDEAEARVRSLAGGGNYDDIVTDIRRQNEEFSRANPWTSVAANIGGGVVPFAGPLGVLRGAARWAGAGRTLPRQMGRGALLGSGVAGVADVGNQEGYERSPGMESTLLGAGVGAAIPPVVRVGGAVLDTAARTIAPQSYQRLRQAMTPAGQRPPPPPEGGVVFVDNPAPEVVNAREGALQLLRDRILQAGGTRADVERALAQLTDESVPGGIANARRYAGSGRGQDVVAPVDVLPGAPRLAGSMVRQYPETQAPASSFISGRQTGITPAGADAAELAGRGIPTRERYAGDLKAGTPSAPGAAEKYWGTAFGAGGDNIVPRGQLARFWDYGKRLFGVKDSDFHGHAATIGATDDAIFAAMRAEAQPAYNKAYAAAGNADTSKLTLPVLNRWAGSWEASMPEVADVIKRMERLLGQHKGQPALLEQFDKAKQYLDNVIDGFMESTTGRNRYIGGVLNKMKDELIASLQPLPNGAHGLYGTARGGWESGMRAREVIKQGGTAFERSTDPATWLRWYEGLSAEEAKLARFSALRGALGSADERDLARDVSGVFRTPRAEAIIEGIVSRTDTPGMLTDRAVRFGRMVNIESEMPRTRDVILGGSATARNLNDDLAMAGLETLQQTQTFLQMFQNSTSLYGLGQQVLQRIIDRSFGLSADRARELSRMLFTANEVDRAEVLRRLISMMPADRMARFNELMTRVNRYATAPSTSAIGGALGQGQPQGPVSL